MRDMARLVMFTVACGLLFASFPTSAQTIPSPTDINVRLRSARPSEVAWAAYEAGTFRVQEAVPALIAVLDALPAGTELEQHRLAATVLDALVQISSVPWRGIQNAVVPSATLAPYLAAHPIPVLILLERLGNEGDTFLVKHFPLLQGGQMWFAVANMLLARGPIGFASALLHELRFQLSIHVVEPGSGPVGTPFRLKDGLLHGDGVGERPRDFPPQAVYKFETQTPGALVLSVGPRPVFYSRTAFTDWQFPLAESNWGAPDGETRLVYLAALLDPFERFNLRSSESATIAWRGDRSFLADVVRVRDELVEKYDRLLDRLVASKHLTEDERRLLPLNLEMEIVDHRDDRRRRLPAVPQR